MKNRPKHFWRMSFLGPPGSQMWRSLGMSSSGVIRANRFARFARIRWFARIRNSSDPCESAWRAIKTGVSIANDSRERIRANCVGNRPCHKGHEYSHRNVCYIFYKTFARGPDGSCWPWTSPPELLRVSMLFPFPPLPCQMLKKPTLILIVISHNGFAQTTVISQQRFSRSGDRHLIQRETKGGGKLKGRGKHTIKPFPKNGFWTPHLWYVFPPRLFSPCCLPWRKPAQTRQIPLAEASKTGFGGRALWYIFPPKIARYVLPPPLAAFQLLRWSERS